MLEVVLPVIFYRKLALDLEVWMHIWQLTIARYATNVVNFPSKYPWIFTIVFFYQVN